MHSQYIRAECLNSLERVLMYGGTVIFDGTACADCGCGRNMGLHIWRIGMRLQMLHLYHIGVDNIKSFIKSMLGFAVMEKEGIMRDRKPANGRSDRVTGATA